MQRILQGPARLLDRGDRAVHPAPADVGHDHDQPTRVTRQPLLGGALRGDRLADVLGDPPADPVQGPLQLPQGRVVVGVAIQPLVQHAHVDGVREDVPEFAGGSDGLVG